MDRTPTRARLTALTFTLAAVLGFTVAGTGCAPKPALVVGSKNFTEQVLLAEILAQHIERRLHLPVGRKFNLGGTLLAHTALTSGAIDLYPEYSGTALTAVLKLPPSKDPAAVMSLVRAAYREQWHLAWLRPLGFNNTFAMMVRGDLARRAGIRSISDAAHNRTWKLGAGYEFKQRPDGLAGLLAAYNLHTDGEPVTMDLGLLYAALKSGRVDLIAASSTDGLAAVLDVVMLDDDRHYFPPYECAVVAREETLARWPGLTAAIEELSGKFPDSVMRKLNFGVDGEHRPPAEVAARFLASIVPTAVNP